MRDLSALVNSSLLSTVAMLVDTIYTQDEHVLLELFGRSARLERDHDYVRHLVCLKGGCVVVWIVYMSVSRDYESGPATKYIHPEPPCTAPRKIHTRQEPMTPCIKSRGLEWIQKGRKTMILVNVDTALCWSLTEPVLPELR
jgi:hypothetical protein